ncbi:MAG: TIGR02588 family protein [Chloroflexota bacterium]|nr:MAG: TIGR02588 family protein [Chloroflexota bacterium]
MAGDDAPRDAESGQKGAGANDIPPLEWAVAMLGAGLVIATLGYLLLLGIGHGQSPPDLQITVQAYTAVESGYLIEFEVFNRGYQPAAQVTVQGSLRAGDIEIETSETTLDYVPSQSWRGGGLYFANDPRSYTLVLRPLGYQRP